MIDRIARADERKAKPAALRRFKVGGLARAALRP
jgi:hypothetical protein